jgi:hypothetical protein
MVDIECASIESNAVVLSVAAIEFKLDEKPNYQDLLERAVFVKFKVEEQIKVYKRHVDAETMEWWRKRPQIIKDKSLTVYPTDVSAVDGLNALRTYCQLKPETRKNDDVVFWARGALDGIVLDSLCRSAGQEILIPFSNWRDVRTAVDLIVDGSSGGYCDVPNFNRFIVQKHDPVHDCAYDIMMLLANNLKVDA